MRYYGGKEKLLGFIESEIFKLNLRAKPTFCDLFSGTAVVGRRFKQAGFRVIANDYLTFAKCLATTRIGLNDRPTFASLNLDPITFLNEIPSISGFFSSTYSPEGVDKRQYFSVENAQRIDAIRTQIHEWRNFSLISECESDYLVAATLEAMNKTSNVSGTYSAYLKTWDPRALKPLSLENPIITPGMGDHQIYSKDAVELAGQVVCDILYLDPPYNSRQYSSNYFLLDVVARGWFDALPVARGITGMRDNTNLRSDFCSKKSALPALEQIITKADARYVVLSYNNEGIIPHDEIVKLMSANGDLAVAQFTHRRYKAINHDPSKRNTTEFLFILEKRSN